MPWFLHTKKHYKIWFSDNPDIFMGMENQLRFIRARLVNTHSRFSLIYSSSLLSITSQQQLLAFCQKYVIQPIDFVVDIPPLLKDESDRKMYAIAKRELSHDGNLAAASDCTQLLVPIIERCGNYSDFDVPINFDSAPPNLPIEYPLVLPAKKSPNGLLCINIDFFGVSFNTQKPDRVSPQALKCLRAIQQRICFKYDNPLPGLLLPVAKGLGTAIEQIPIQAAIARHFFQKNPGADIWGYRKYLNQPNPGFAYLLIQGDRRTLNLVTRAEFSINAPQMFHQSVIDFSGASSFYAMFSAYIPADGFVVTPVKTGLQVRPDDKWRAFLSAMESSTLENNGLEAYVNVRNTIEAEKYSPAEIIDLGIRDASWMPLGKQKLLEREQKIYSSALIIKRVLHKAVAHSKVCKKTKETSTGKGLMAAAMVKGIFSTPSMFNGKEDGAHGREIKAELIRIRQRFSG